MSNVIKKSIDFLSIAILGLIVLLMLLCNVLSFWTILSIACIFILNVLIYKFISKLSQKQCVIIISLVMITFFILLCYFGYHLRVDPSWDYGRIYRSAVDIASTSMLTVDPEYFLESNNNLFVTIILALWIKSTQFLKYNSLYSCIIFNIIAIFISAVLIIITLYQRFNHHIALLTSIICLLFTPFYTYATIFYTDTLSMPFICAALFIWHRLNKSPDRYSPIYWLLLSLCAFLGYKVKASVGILIIAIIISLLLQYNIKIIKGIVIFCAFTFCLLFSYNTLIEKSNILDMSLIDNYRLPKQHYIMMGLKGSGGYNYDDHCYSLSFKTIDERIAAENEEIVKRFKSYNLHSYTKFLSGKIKYTWLDGTYFAPNKLAINKVESTYINEFFCLDGQYYNIYRFIANAFHYSMLVFMAIAAVSQLKENDDMLRVCLLSFIGLFLFLIVWETRSRYIVNFTPLFITVYSISIANTYEKIKLLKNTKKFQNT